MGRFQAEFQSRVRRPVLVAVAVAVLAAIASLIVGFSGSVGAMTALTGVTIVAMLVALLLAFRASTRPRPGGTAPAPRDGRRK